MDDLLDRNIMLAVFEIFLTNPRSVYIYEPTINDPPVKRVDLAAINCLQPYDLDLCRRYFAILLSEFVIDWKIVRTIFTEEMLKERTNLLNHRGKTLYDKLKGTNQQD